MKEPIGQRLLSKCRINEIGCWEWTGGCNSNGYGSMYVGGACRGTHCLAYEEFLGPIPEGLCVCHHCDNRKCFNPEHLFVDTREGNNKDRHLKGRSGAPKGRRHGRYSHGFFVGLKTGTPEYNEAARKLRAHRKKGT